MTVVHDTVTPTTEQQQVGKASGPRSSFLRSRAGVTLIQGALLAAFFLIWEYGPKVESLREAITFLDPYYISSPSAVWDQLKALSTGDDTISMWSYVGSTVTASVIGIVAGTVLGAIAGLLLSNSPALSDVFRPFLIAINAVPRIALIPIVVIICGPSLKASIVTAVMIVFFVVFFNAYEGGRSVPAQVVQNARMLGASPRQVMFRIRLRYVQAWSFAALPNAVSFGLMAVVTSEILTGTEGLGRLLLESVTTVQASLTFAVVVVLSVLGLVFVVGTDILNKRLMHWWSNNDR